MAPPGREVTAEAVAGCLHVVVPDRCGQRASEAGTEAVDVGHRSRVVRVAGPHGGRELRGVADEPRVGVVAGRAGLAGGRAAVVGGGAGALGDHRFQHLGSRVRLSGREHPCRRRRAEVDDASIGEHDLADDRRRIVKSAVCERGIGVGHLQRRDADLQTADRLGRVPEQRRGDPHRVCGRIHLVHPQIDPQLREHGVVGDRRRLGDADVSLIALLSGVHRVGRVTGEPSRRQEMGVVVGQVRVAVVVLDQRHQHEHLER